MHNIFYFIQNIVYIFLFYFLYRKIKSEATHHIQRSCLMLYQEIKSEATHHILLFNKNSCE